MTTEVIFDDRRAFIAHLLDQVQDWASTEQDLTALATAFASCATGGPAAAYADQIVAAALTVSDETIEGKAAILAGIDRLLDALYQTVVPAEVSMLAASVVAHTWFRIGEPAAERAAAGMVARCAIVPRLQAAAAPATAALGKVIAMVLEDLAEGLPFGERPGSRLAALKPEFPRYAALFEAWVHDLVAAGNFALAIRARWPDADPDDVASQATAIIASDAALASAFLQPTPLDPLGTSPRYGLTAIGQAIEVARQERSTDYDWAAVQQLADTAPGEFAALLRDERLHVLDNVRL